ESKPVHLGRIAALIILVLFVGVSTITFVYGLVLSRSLRAERLDLQMNIDRMQEQSGRMTAELRRLQAQYQDYGKALAILQRELPSVEFLGVLERALPPGVWLERMSISVAMAGFAFTENDVVSFGRALSEALVVTSVGFPVTTRVRQESGASVRFSLDCSIRDIMSITPATEDDGQVQEVASR
ncbi:MAG TPA: PilN domain-containing protein, partial [Aminivibrio sp.]|nr:PilN domain-containing protein [Aminivibrio sp.]